MAVLIGVALIMHITHKETSTNIKYLSLISKAAALKGNQALPPK